MRWFAAWPMMLLQVLVTATLLPFADAFKGQRVLLRATAIVKGIPAALREIVDGIDVRVVLEESTAEPASEVFTTPTQPDKERVLEPVARSQGAIAALAPPDQTVPEDVHWPPVGFGDWPPVARSQGAIAALAPPDQTVPEDVHWPPVGFGDWPAMDETITITSGMPVCDEPRACAVATLSSVAPLDVAAFHVDDLSPSVWPPLLGLPVMDETITITSGMPVCDEPRACAVTTLSSVAPLDVAAFHVDDLSPSVWPPFLDLPAKLETSPTSWCDEPGACAVATLSLVTPLDLPQMIERALLAEASRAAGQLITVSQTQRMLRDWDLSMVRFAVPDNTLHYQLGFGNQFGFGSLMSFIQTNALDGWSGNGSAMLARLTESLPFSATFSPMTVFFPGYRLTDSPPSFPSVIWLYVFGLERVSDLLMARWDSFYSYSMMALLLCGALSFVWLLLTFCRRLWLLAGGVPHPVGSERVEVDPRVDKMWLAFDGLLDHVAGVEAGDAADRFRGTLTAAIEGAVAVAVEASEKRMEAVFLKQLAVERGTWQSETEKLVKRAVAETRKENREGKWKKNLSRIEGRVLGSVDDRLGAVLTNNDEEYAKAAQKAQLAATAAAAATTATAAAAAAAAATSGPEDEDGVEDEDLLKLS